MEPVIIGEASGKMTSEISKEEQLRVLLRVNWTAKSEEVPFNPEEDLKVGDKIKVTMEKISEAPASESG